MLTLVFSLLVGWTLGPVEGAAVLQTVMWPQSSFETSIYKTLLHTSHVSIFLKDVVNSGMNNINNSMTQ